MKITDSNYKKLLSQSLDKFKKKYPEITSADLQTYLIAWEDAFNAFISLLPSDEEIRKEFVSNDIKYYTTRKYYDINKARMQGAKWLKQQILNKLK